MRLYIVRHGETDYNRDGYMQGRLETSLNNKGRIQAGLCGEKLKNINFDSIISSSQKRALQTAKIISSHHSNVEVREETLLQEIDCGEWCGKNWEDIKKEYSHIDFSVLKASKFVKLHKGESYNSVKSRIEAFFDIIDKEFSKSSTILLITHGFIIKSMVSTLLDININNKNSFSILNAGITIIDRDSSNNINSLITLNDVSHLSEVNYKEEPKDEQVY